MMQVGKAVGMVTLNDALMDLVTKKLVAPEEAYAKAIDKSGMEAQLKRAGLRPVKPRRARRRPAAAPAPPGRPGASRPSSRRPTRS